MEVVEQFNGLLKEAFQKLPTELQKNVIWLFQNIEIADELLKNSFMTEESRQKCMKQAKEHQEYMLWMLLFYQKFKQEEEAADRPSV